MPASLNKVQMWLQLTTETGHCKQGLHGAGTEKSAVIAAVMDLQH